MGRGEEAMRPGAGVEAVAASDPEVCREVKYGLLPEQMQSPLGNSSKPSGKVGEQREKGGHT